MTIVTFYHSAVCPRCRLASLALKAVLEDYPDVSLQRVEYLTNLRAARTAGVRSIPALASEGRTVSGFLLTKSRLRSFLDSLGEDGPSSADSSAQG